MGDVIRYNTAGNSNASRGPSPILWADCPIQDFGEDPGKGIHQFDDFQNSVVLQEEAARTAWTGGIGHITGDINCQGYAE